MGQSKIFFLLRMDSNLSLAHEVPIAALKVAAEKSGWSLFKKRNSTTLIGLYFGYGHKILFYIIYALEGE